MRSAIGKSYGSRIWRLLAVVLLVCLLLDPGRTVNATGTPIKGIDVSRWQGVIDWTKVKEAGIEFVMIGIGRYRNGVGIPDTQFENNMKNAIENGIHVGVYLYSEAVTEEEARAEANFVLDQIDGYKISYPVAFDIEDTVHTTLTTKARTDITIAFLEVIEEAGYYPMIYASQNWLNERMDLSRLTKYDKWVARWSTTVEFSPLSMWQYSCTGSVAGISGHVDLDYSYKDYSKLITPRYSALKRNQAGWRTDGTNHWYVKEDGSIVKSCLYKIDGNIYLFNSKGYRMTGWQKLGGNYYYFVKATGVMKRGWMTMPGSKKYYLNPSTGKRTTGFATIGGKRYYFDSNGILKKNGWITVGKYKYYLEKNGEVHRGWLTLNGKKYFMSTGVGRMCTGWLKAGGKYYYFAKKTGEMQKGWLKIGSRKYYLNKNGARVHGWKKLNGNWYYFKRTNGVMQRNTTLGKYKFDSKGVCRNYK